MFCKSIKNHLNKNTWEEIICLHTILGKQSLTRIQGGCTLGLMYIDRSSSRSPLLLSNNRFTLSTIQLRGNFIPNIQIFLYIDWPSPEIINTTLGKQTSRQYSIPPFSLLLLVQCTLVSQVNI